LNCELKDWSLTEFSKCTEIVIGTANVNGDAVNL